MEIFDVIDKDGNPTGETVTREQAHTEGIPLRWILQTLMKIRIFSKSLLN